jgi:hypothetical protein
MKMVYTQKGLDFRKELKSELEHTHKVQNYITITHRSSNSKFKFGQKINSFLKGTTNDNDKSFKFPDFENLKVEVVKTSRGEIKERPLALVSELDNHENFEVAHYNLNNKNTRILKRLLNDEPANIYRKYSVGNLNPPKIPRQTTSFMNILGMVESPSHWRFFENKKNQTNRMFSPQASDMRSSRHFPSMDKLKGTQDTEHNYATLDNKFPYNIEKIFRKHAEQQEKRQSLR